MTEINWTIIDYGSITYNSNRVYDTVVKNDSLVTNTSTKESDESIINTNDYQHVEHGEHDVHDEHIEHDEESSDEYSNEYHSDYGEDYDESYYAGYSPSDYGLDNRNESDFESDEVNDSEEDNSVNSSDEESTDDESIDDKSTDDAKSDNLIKKETSIFSIIWNNKLEFFLIGFALSVFYSDIKKSVIKFW